MTMYTLYPVDPDGVREGRWPVVCETPEEIADETRRIINFHGPGWTVEQEAFDTDPDMLDQLLIL